MITTLNGVGKRGGNFVVTATNPAGPWSEPGIRSSPTAAIIPMVTCTGHADLVETQAGEWWMVLLGVRANDAKTAMGREAFLVPVDWSDMWPVVNPHGRVGRVEAVMPAPNLPTFHPASTRRATTSRAPSWRSTGRCCGRRGPPGGASSGGRGG